MSDSENSEFIWTPAYEVQLMFAMIGLKPVGVNKYFNMARIIEKFSAAINRTVEADTIWNHLDTWYDIKKWDVHPDNQFPEPLPFSNDEVDFELPEDEFGALMEQAKRNGPRQDRSDYSQKKSQEDNIKREHIKEDNSKDDVKEDDGMTKSRNKVDKRTPLRRVSKSDKTDSSGAEESKEKDEEKVLPGGRTRRSIKNEEPTKEDSNDSIKRNDPASAKKLITKKEVGSDSTKKRSVGDVVDLNKSDTNSKRLGSRTPVKSVKEPEQTPKRVTRASIGPSELESAKRKRKR